MRRTSQLELSARAGISARHISFIESGRAQPSRWTLDILAEALSLPRRDRDELLRQAGFVPPAAPTPLKADLSRVLRELEPLIEGLHPYPCLLLDRRTRIVRANTPARVLLGMLAPGGGAVEGGSLSVGELLLSREVRDVVTNLSDLAPGVIARLCRQTAIDAGMAPLLTRVLTDPTIPAAWKAVDAAVEQPTRRLDLRVGGAALSFVLTSASLGTVSDITFDELWLEVYLPRDDASHEALCALLASVDAEAPRLTSPPRAT